MEQRYPPVLEGVQGEVDVGHALAETPQNFVTSHPRRSVHRLATIQTNMPNNKP